MSNKDKPEKSDSKEEPKTAVAADDEASGVSSFMSGLLSKLNIKPSSPKPKVLEEPTVECLANYIKSSKCKNIVVMAGAGISTSAGIPDFRSPGSGLYSSIQETYNLSDPQIIFEIGFFRQNPKPFYALAKQLLPTEFGPTTAHRFVQLLHKKGLLLRHYTQNIDGLERKAGIPDDKIVEAHGTFYTSHCTNFTCKKDYNFDWMKEKIQSDEVPKCTKCDSVIKPDVIFFGENLPTKFFTCASSDFDKCDLLIIMGTSLVVQPFASLVEKPSEDTPRLLINREAVGTPDASLLGQLLKKFGGHEDFDLGLASQFIGKGLNFESPTNRDVALLGDCDDGVRKLAKILGWEEELDKLKNEAV